jgi:hypothetical protein
MASQAQSVQLDPLHVAPTHGGDASPKQPVLHPAPQDATAGPKARTAQKKTALTRQPSMQARDFILAPVAERA